MPKLGVGALDMGEAGRRHAENSRSVDAGLYGIYDNPENRPYMDGISIRGINTSGNRVVGAVFSFLGFRLLLFLDTNGPQLPLMEIGTGEGETSELIEPTYHPKAIDYLAGVGISHR